MDMFWVSLIINIITTIVVAALVSFSILGKEWIAIQLGRYKFNKRIYKAGITNIYESRDDYTKYRNYPRVAPKLIDYLALAEKNIFISAYWMAHGTEIEGIAEEIFSLVRPPKNLNITVSVINPRSTCISAVALHLGIEDSQLVDRIDASIMKLKQEKNRLSEEEKKKLVIKTYDSLPVASVIILDYGYDNGRMQIEFKPYHVARHYNFSIELSGKDKGLYKLFSHSYIKQINDAVQIY
jgi:hypothetical protein